MTAVNKAKQLVIGLVAWQALPVIEPAQGRSVGGLETGAWTLARGIARHSALKVQFFVHTKSRGTTKIVNDVEVVQIPNFIETIRREVSSHVDVGPPFRLKKWNLGLLWKIPFLLVTKPFRPDPPKPMSVDNRLSSENVDVWCGFGVNGDSARVAATAISQSKPMLLFLESNADLDLLRRGSDTSHRNAYGELLEEQLFALKNASVVICQSNWQMDRLRTDFSQMGILIRNPIDVQDWKPRDSRQRAGVLWIGRYDDFHKRPALAMRIAASCPDVSFTFIINPGDAEIEADVRKNCPGNVTIVDYVPFRDMPSKFASAAVFLCTGDPSHEGFPNVLLQAAAARTPIVSLNDFDGFLVESGAGVVCNESLDFASMHVKQLANGNQIDWERAEHFLIENYSTPSIVSKFEEAVRTVVARLP